MLTSDECDFLTTWRKIIRDGFNLSIVQSGLSRDIFLFCPSFVQNIKTNSN